MDQVKHILGGRSNSVHYLERVCALNSAADDLMVWTRPEQFATVEQEVVHDQRGRPGSKPTT
jgi:hypothetical protein